MSSPPIGGGDQDLPQLQLAPQVQDSQAQSGLLQALLLPQLQSGPQVHGSQVQAGFSHFVLPLMGLILGCPGSS